MIFNTIYIKIIIKLSIWLSASLLFHLLSLRCQNLAYLHTNSSQKEHFNFQLSLGYLVFSPMLWMEVFAMNLFLMLSMISSHQLSWYFISSVFTSIFIYLSHFSINLCLYSLHLTFVINFSPFSSANFHNFEDHKDFFGY